MPYNNEFYLASAGAGKTTLVVNYAVKHPNQKILLTTYTHENTALLQETICTNNGFQPSNVIIMSWFSFLLSECVRPYQNYIYADMRIDNLDFFPYISAKFSRRTEVKRFYLSSENHIYSDKMSDFACCCNEKSHGLVIKRLEELIDVFILDEAQDISGWDLDFIELLIKSKIKVIMVGDVRQRTYSTSKSIKNKKYSDDIYLWFTHLESAGYGELKLYNQSYRCSQAICDFADELFPTLPKTVSHNHKYEGHTGIYIINSKDLHEYCDLFSPQILAYDKRAKSKALGLSFKNFGVVKGQTYNHVVIIPTKPIETYLGCGDATVITSREKLYVAITRARYSVAFLSTCNTPFECIRKWKV